MHFHGVSRVVSVLDRCNTCDLFTRFCYTSVRLSHDKIADCQVAHYYFVTQTIIVSAPILRSFDLHRRSPKFWNCYKCNSSEIDPKLSFCNTKLIARMLSSEIQLVLSFVSTTKVIPCNSNCTFARCQSVILLRNKVAYRRREHLKTGRATENWLFGRPTQ